MQEIPVYQTGPFSSLPTANTNHSFRNSTRRLSRRYGKRFSLLYKLIVNQKSDCSNHNAVNKERSGKMGYAVSGTGAVNCARHDMKRACGMGDLQKGERYVQAICSSPFKVLITLCYVDTSIWTLSLLQVCETIG